ncbi:MAG TPA: hypothetical protein VFS91_11530, partial [Nitrobacter sp.]|nr:hypothetical protein [Nitrobacter sp.]
RSKIMNVIDSNILRSGMRAENRTTLFLIPLLPQAQDANVEFKIPLAAYIFSGPSILTFAGRLAEAGCEC